MSESVKHKPRKSTKLVLKQDIILAMGWLKRVKNWYLT